MQASNTLLVIMLVFCLCGAIPLFFTSLSAWKQQYSWEKVIGDCVYDYYEETITYYNKDSEIVIGYSTDRCDPYDVYFGSTNRTCWYDPDTPEHVRLLPLWRHSSIETAISFFAVFIFLPFLVISIRWINKAFSTKQLLAISPFLIIFSSVLTLGFSAIFLARTRSKLLVQSYNAFAALVMILTFYFTLVLPGTLESNRLQESNCTTVSWILTNPCPFDSLSSLSN